MAAAETGAARGPAVPSASAAVAHRPLAGAGARLTAGLLHAWQQRNAEASLPLALRQLETAGNLANVRLAISGAREGYRGPVFMDSDIYKVAGGDRLGTGPVRRTRTWPASWPRATALLEKAQQPDGYLNSYIQVSGRPRYSFLASSHELYCAGHLIQAGDRLPARRRGSRRCSRWPGGSPTTWSITSWAGEDGHRRPPHRRDRARGAVPGNGPRTVPAPGQPVHRAARARADRRLRVRRTATSRTTSRSGTP